MKCNLGFCMLLAIWTNVSLVFMCYRLFSPSEPVWCQIVKNTTLECELQLVAQCTELEQIYSRKQTVCHSEPLPDKGNFPPFTMPHYVLVDGFFPTGTWMWFYASDGFVFTTVKEWDGADVILTVYWLCVFLGFEVFCGWILYKRWKSDQPIAYVEMQ